MELPGKQERCCESEDEYADPGAILSRLGHCLERFGMTVEPIREATESAKNTKHGDAGDQNQCQQFHQGFKGDGDHKPFVLLTR